MYKNFYIWNSESLKKETIPEEIEKFGIDF